MSRDERVLAKIEEVANNNKLQGYAISPSGKLYTVLEEHYTLVAGCFMAAIVLMLAIAWTRKSKSQSGPLVAGAGILTLILIFHINFSAPPEQGIIANPYTYIMTGPSAGASVVAIVGEGHQLEILGRKDVWIRVKWMEKEAFIRDGGMLLETL